MRRGAATVLLVVGVLMATASAQPQPTGKLWRLGAFHVGLDHIPPSLEPLREGLKELGYEEGKNLRLDWRNLPDEEAARATAREFVRDRVDLIVAFENQTVRAAKAATAEIPVVFLHATDPVEAGFVKSLAKPGGNMTGFAGFIFDFPGKQLELFKEVVPRLRRVLVLSDPDDPVAGRLMTEVRVGARQLKLDLVERMVTQQTDIERLFTALPPRSVDGVFIASSNLHVKFQTLLIRLAAEKRWPFPTYRKEWVHEGALFSYAPDIPPIGRAAAHYIDRILKGTPPADLPVERPARFELVINLKVAATLGLTIPQAVLFRADEVIR